MGCSLRRREASAAEPARTRYPAGPYAPALAPTLALALWPSSSSPHRGQALSFRTFERDAKRAVDAVAAKAQLDAP